MTKFVLETDKKLSKENLSPPQIPPFTVNEGLVKRKQNVCLFVCAEAHGCYTCDRVGMAPIGAMYRKKRKKSVNTNTNTFSTITTMETSISEAYSNENKCALSEMPASRRGYG